jgi:hypothetical protein
MLTGYGAEHFAVDQHGNLYLAEPLDMDGSAGAQQTIGLNVMAVSHG